MKWTVLFATLMLTACSSTPSGEPEPELGSGAGRSFPIQVDASAREAGKEKSFRVSLESGLAPSLQEEENLRKLERALELAGYKKAAALPELEVTVSFGIEKPMLGLTLGTLNGYTHRVKIAAAEKSGLLWELHASGPSEHEDNRAVFPYLMLGSLPYFGKSSGGQKRVNARDDDPRLNALLDPGSPDTRKRGLLEQ